MFRNALRQSARAVGAVSASGRVASVSPSKAPATDPIGISRAAVSFCCTSDIVFSGCRSVGCFWRLSQSPSSSSEQPSADDFCSRYRPEPLPLSTTLLQNSSEAMLPMRKPPLPRSPPSSNRELEVYKRSLVLQRLDGCCLLGVSILPSVQQSYRSHRANNRSTVTVSLVSTV